MVYLRNYLWSHISRSPTEGIDSSCFFAAQTKAEVYQFELPISVDEDVFSLDVPMDYVQFMQVL